MLLIKSGSEAVQIGLATHLVPFEKFKDFEEHLQNISIIETFEIEDIINHYAHPLGKVQ